MNKHLWHYVSEFLETSSHASSKEKKSAFAKGYEDQKDGKVDNNIYLKLANSCPNWVEEKRTAYFYGVMMCKLDAQIIP